MKSFPMKSFISVFWMILALVFSFTGTGCISTPQKPAKQTSSIPRLPPTEKGARLSRTGEAVAEVKLPFETAFEVVENYFRQNFKVTFVNQTAGKLEAENKEYFFLIGFTSLTTGKTGITVAVTPHAKKFPDPYASLELADEILTVVQNSRPEISRPEKSLLKVSPMKPRDS